MSDYRKIESILYETLDKAESSDYIGYSKFDGLNSPLLRILSFGFWPLRLIWTQIIMRSPVNLRPLLLVKKDVNPESPALFARANLDIYSLENDGRFRKRAEHCLACLEANDSKSKGGYHGSCWGYNHPWQSTGFYQPPAFPNCYMTVIVGGAFLHGFRTLKNDKYLKIARSAVEFVTCDLDIVSETDEEKCISYVPKIKKGFCVININALAAGFLAQVGSFTGEAALIEQARKLLMFVSRQQTSYGAWHYTINPRQSLISHDNYHTGMILDAFLEYECATGDQQFRPCYEKGLRFYEDNLFLWDGAPKWASDQIYPHDIHGSAQGILTFAGAEDWKRAFRIAQWAIQHFHKGNGDFSYQKDRFISKRFTLTHWCNGWMARGLAALRLFKKQP